MRCVLGFDIYYYRVMHAQTKFSAQLFYQIPMNLICNDRYMDNHVTAVKGVQITIRIKIIW